MDGIEKSGAMTFIEEHLRDSLAGLLASRAVAFLENDESVFAGIAAAFPMAMHDIDWARCPGRRYEPPGDPGDAAALRFLEERVAEAGIRPDEQAFVAGDAGSHGGVVETSVRALREVLPSFLDTPQAIYVVGSDFRWCMAFKMIGATYFAFGPTRYNGLDGATPEWDGAEVALERLEARRPGSGFRSEGEVYIRREAAAEFLKICEELRLLLLGAELFDLVDGGHRPDTGGIADFSGLHRRWEARRSIIEMRRFVSEAPASKFPQAFSFVAVFRNPRR